MLFVFYIDPIEVEQLDKKTVHKLQELRAEYQLEDEQRKELESDTIRDNVGFCFINM